MGESIYNIEWEVNIDMGYCIRTDMDSQWYIYWRFLVIDLLTLFGDTSNYALYLVIELLTLSTVTSIDAF